MTIPNQPHPAVVVYVVVQVVVWQGMILPKKWALSHFILPKGQFTSENQFLLATNTTHLVPSTSWAHHLFTFKIITHSERTRGVWHYPHQHHHPVVSLPALLKKERLLGSYSFPKNHDPREGNQFSIWDSDSWFPLGAGYISSMFLGHNNIIITATIAISVCTPE